MGSLVTHADESNPPPEPTTPSDSDSVEQDAVNQSAPPNEETTPLYSLEERPSFLDDADAKDVCPNCNAPMPYPDAVVCLKCGFDQTQNKIIKPKVGADEVEPKSDEPAGAKDFVRPGRLGWKAPLGIGFALIIAAAVLSGVHAPSRSILHAIATLLYAPIYAGIGVAAVMTTAVLMEDRMGKLELAVGRMTLAVGLAILSWHIAFGLGLGNPLPFLLGASVGGGLYFLTVWWTFSLNRTVATLLSLLHLSLWIVFLGLLKLSALLATTPPAS